MQPIQLQQHYNFYNFYKLRLQAVQEVLLLGVCWSLPSLTMTLACPWRVEAFEGHTAKSWSTIRQAGM